MGPCGRLLRRARRSYRTRTGALQLRPEERRILEQNYDQPLGRHARELGGAVSRFSRKKVKRNWPDTFLQMLFNFKIMGRGLATIAAGTLLIVGCATVSKMQTFKYPDARKDAQVD